MGKKKPEEMQKQRDRFVDGCIGNGVDEKEAGDVFDLIVEFAGYGFPKAHSTAYAYITYQTAYLRANHLPEYLAARGPHVPLPLGSGGGGVGGVAVGGRWGRGGGRCCERGDRSVPPPPPPRAGPPRRWRW